MGLSGSKNISCFVNFSHSALGAVRGTATATVTPLSTGVSRYRVISLSCFVRSRTRFRRFTVKRVSATGDKIEKSIAGAGTARGLRHRGGG